MKCTNSVHKKTASVLVLVTINLSHILYSIASNWFP